METEQGLAAIFNVLRNLNQNRLNCLKTQCFSKNSIYHNEVIHQTIIVVQNIKQFERSRLEKGENFAPKSVTGPRDQRFFLKY